MEKIIIDTDPGIDDALAIMLAVKSGFFDIKAITTVMGNSSIGNTTRNAKCILNLLKDNKIPIYSGADKPLEGNFKTSFLMGEGGLGGLASSFEISLTGDASERILQIIENNPYEITLIAIGPLTNIARAIQTNSDIMKKLKKLVIMGGAIKSPGNMSRVAEFNIFNDPLAADIVFNFSIPKVLIPLDLCYSVELSSDDFNKIGGDLKDFIKNLTEGFMKRLEINETGKRTAIVYDALAVYYLLNREIYNIQKLDVRVETSGELTRGMTVADFRKVSIKEANFDVAFGIDKEKFVKDFIEILTKETLINKENLSKKKEEAKKI